MLRAPWNARSLLFLSALACLVGCAPTDRLEPGVAVDLQGAPGSVQRLHLRVARGDLVHLQAEQLGLDVGLRIGDSPEIDLPFGAYVTEDAWFEAQQSGDLTIRVESLGGDGRARLRARLLEHGETAIELSQRFHDTWEGFDALKRGDTTVASKLLGQPPHPDLPPRWQAVARGFLARAQSEAGDKETAVDTLSQALEILESLEEPALEARLRIDRCRLLRDLGRLDEAKSEAARARDRATRAEDFFGRGLAANLLAIVEDLQGGLLSAIAGFSQAIQAFDLANAPRKRIQAELNLARCWMKLGAMDRARWTLEQTLQSLEGLAADDRREIRSQTLRALGWWHHLNDEDEIARPILEEALALDPGHLGTMDRLATTYVGLGELESARELYDRVSRELADEPFWKSHLETNLCRLELAVGALPTARQHCDKALQVFEHGAARGSIAQVLLLLGKIEMAAGDLRAAERHLSRSVAVLEDQREQTTPPEVRSLFLAERLESYRLLIQVRMSLHRQKPQAGWDQEALATFELTRARVLRDYLIRAAGTEADVLPSPEIANLHELQQLLDPETALVFVHLGDSGSTLWWLTGDELESFALPPKGQIEPLALSWYRLLANPLQKGPWSHEIEAQRAQRLSGLLLEPISRYLARQRLVFVVDGVLQRLPLGALPSPATPERPLIVDQEIVHLPSASVLALLRRQVENRPPAPGLIALIADPVYGPDDARLGLASRGTLSVETGGHRSEPYLRLTNTTAEAQEILELLPEGSFLLLEGFEANRRQVLSGVLNGYRILHFATHAETGSGRPLGLILSQFSPQGKPIEGRLGLGGLYGLELPAELAVLSACSTGIGENLEGEGLISLTRGFMHAGTPRVVVSLWAVEDRATRDLMTELYTGLSKHCLSPAQALHRAQKAFWLDGRPKYQWASFQIQGDWRPFPLCSADPTVRPSDLESPGNKN